MRTLNVSELAWVSGGGEASVTVGPVKVEVKGDTSKFGQALIDLYEGAVAATSHVIERVAEALK